METLEFLMQLKYRERARLDNELKKPVLWNCVLQLHITLPDNSFKAFLQKIDHSLVPLILGTINDKRWYNFSM